MEKIASAAAREALEKQLQELQERFNDAELERKIAERKSQQMVPAFLTVGAAINAQHSFIAQMKELKNQLAKERAKLQKGGLAASSPMPSPVPSPRRSTDGIHSQITLSQ